MVSFIGGSGGGTSTSAAWSGWEDHSSTDFTEIAPWQPTPNVWTSFPHNNGSSITSQSPLDVADMFADSKVTGRNGDAILLTVEFLGKPTTASVTTLRSALFIGGSLGPLGDGRIYSRPISFPKGQGLIEAQTYTTGMFTLGTFEANGGAVQFNPTAAIDIWSVRVVPFRLHKAR